MQVVGSNIAIGLYVLDMWSVLFVMYVGGMFKYSDWTERTGYVVSVLCSCGLWGSNIAIELYILNIWSVLCVQYVGVGV